MWRHYIYKHVRKDTGEVFYIGKGSMRKDRAPSYERAYAKVHARNPFWKNVVAKAGFEVVLVASCKTDEEAQRLEKQLISEIGRRDLKNGPLVNLTDGGDGHCGIIVSERIRKIRSENSKGPRSEKWIEAIRKARKNGGNGGVVKLGDKLPESWRENISKGQRGPNNYMRGRTGKAHPMSRRVFNVKTCKVYESVSEAAGTCGYKLKTLYNWLSGHRKNPTNLRFI